MRNHIIQGYTSKVKVHMNVKLFASVNSHRKIYVGVKLKLNSRQFILMTTT